MAESVELADQYDIQEYAQQAVQRYFTLHTPRFVLNDTHSMSVVNPDEATRYHTALLDMADGCDQYEQSLHRGSGLVPPTLWVARARNIARVLARRGVEGMWGAASVRALSNNPRELQQQTLVAWQARARRAGFDHDGEPEVVYRQVFLGWLGLERPEDFEFVVMRKKMAED